MICGDNSAAIRTELGAGYSPLMTERFANSLARGYIPYLCGVEFYGENPSAIQTELRAFHYT